MSGQRIGPPTKARIVVFLTRAEAVALSHAICNSIDSDDDRKALFPSGPQRAAVLRGAQKLDDAIYGPRAVPGLRA